MSFMDNMLGAASGSARAQSPQPPDDSLGSIMQGVAGGDPAKAAGVMGTMMDLLNQKGGLGGMLDAFRSNGLGAQADSWVGTGANIPVSGDQVERVLGGPIINQIASRMGLSPEQAKATLAQLVPTIVDRMTPSGQVTGESDQELSKALAMFKNLIG